VPDYAPVFDRRCEASRYLRHLRHLRLIKAPACR
jgi:hypothetical protein